MFTDETVVSGAAGIGAGDLFAGLRGPDVIGTGWRGSACLGNGLGTGSLGVAGLRFLVSRVTVWAVWATVATGGPPRKAE